MVLVGAGGGCGRWVRRVRVVVVQVVSVPVAPVQAWLNLRPWMSGSLGWGGSMGGCGCAGGRALLWGSCWRRAMSALALLRCAWAASSLHHPATRRPPFPCCRVSRLSVANSVGGAAVPRVCEGGSAGLRRQAGTLPGYGDEGTRSPTLRGAQLTPTAPTAAGPSRHDPRLAWPGVSHKDPSGPSGSVRVRISPA